MALARIRELDGGSKFRVVRGFPFEGTLFADLEIAPNATIEFGDPVALDAQGRLIKANTADQAIGFAYGDSDVPNNRASGKITVLLGAFVAITQKYNKTQTYQPGDKLTIKDGQIDKAADGDVVIGRVLRVNAAKGELEFVYKGVD